MVVLLFVRDTLVPGLDLHVSTSASDCLKRLISKMTYYVSSGT